ncbi:MAG: amidohydrolase family protein [Psychroserpens sp.]|uniref:amidohydrolase family protein n=1 Tax=Psychroserpens sp. TaxID=2020870 RepID=UPI0030013ACA
MNPTRLIIFIALIVITGCKNDNYSFKVNNGLLVENVTIISANKDGIIEKYNGHVLIDNETILYSGIQKPIATGNLKNINGKGKFIIPGLIDSHVHLANVAGMTWRNQRNHPKLAKSYFTQLPKSYLYYGYTTLIDVNNYAPDILDEIKNHSIRPDIYTCGQQIQVMNDFMMEMEELPLKDRLEYPFLFDKYNKNIYIPDSINLDLHSPQAIVTNILREQQSIGVKIVYEDESSGFPQSWELPSLNLMRDLVEQTQKKGIPVLMHATSYDAQKIGLEAGIDIFAHPMWNWYKQPERFLDTEFTQDHQDVLKEIATRKIGNQLTFRTIYGEVDLFEDNFNADLALIDIYPGAYLNWLNTEEGNWGKQKILNRAKIIKAINPTLYNYLRPQFESDEAMFRGIQQVFIVRMNTVAKFLSDNDATLLFGTDGVAMNMSTNPPGYNGFLEMQHWVNAGISLEKIFIAATFNNASAFHIEDKYGTIEKGKTANLLLLDEDPLLNISAYDQINSVIIRGKNHPRNTLSANQNN